MSSTNRGGQRIADDVYETPAWCVHRLLDEVDLPGGRWLEPCAGDGAIIAAVGDAGIEWTAVELRPAAERSLLALPCGVEIGDYLRRPPPTDPAGGWERPYDVAITNPPYALAPLFLAKMLREARIIVALLRLNFLASERRAAFMRQHRPSVYVLPNRPSFTGGTTDSCEYAWFVFRAEPQGVVHVLEPTPAEQRRCQPVAPVPRGEGAR